MSFARKAWHLIVAVKDGLVLLFLLLFFGLLYALLTATPSPAQIREGALLIDLNGYIVEERSEVDPFEVLLSGTAPIGEYDARELIGAIDAAAGDERVKAVVLDLSSFLGGGQVHLQDIGAALDRFRAAQKPVLTYAVGYSDAGMMLAAHSSEVWLDPLGGAFITGPGGERLYYKGLLDKLKVNARVYKVGTYKSAVEPFLRTDMSPAARENYEALYGALWEEWQANVKKARPQLKLEQITEYPVETLDAANGDLATAALNAGLVDKLGNRVQFGERVAQIAGEDDLDEMPGTYAHTDYDIWLTGVDIDTPGKAIGVITVAGEIVDGDAGPGTAGGDRIANLLNEALDEDFAALVVRVDSPGGSVLASEMIREAILRHKAKGIPIAVSMANVAASGGYWVATPADRIFAEPETVTGSIGIFGIIPTFEDTAAAIGVNSDGVRTTPLSGQPDLIAGFTPEVDAILQKSIENGYMDFITRVADARNLTTAQVDVIGQGRVWDGGTARQIGLVDQYGGLEDALAWAAAQAKLEGGDWHPRFIGSDTSEYDNLLRSIIGGESQRSAGSNDLFGMIAWRQQIAGERMLSDLERLTGTRGMQAYCLECPSRPAARSSAQSTVPAQSWMAKLALMFAS